MPTQTPSIHGHEILRLLAATPLTAQELRRVAAARFGPDARYHTCSAQEFSLDELLDFLRARGKFIEHEGRLHANLGQMCDGEGHGDGH